MSSNSSNSSNSSGAEVILNSAPFKQISPAKRWCFTLNNYTDTDISSIVPIFDELCKVVIIGREIGAECKTPHLQGYLEFHTKRRPKSLGLNSKIHYEKARGNKMQNVEYCQKEGNVCFSKGIPLPVITILEENFFSYQKELVDIFKVPCEWNDRTIYWRWGDINIGKTQFAKYCCVKLGACVIGGTHKHMLAQAQNADCGFYIILLSYGDEEIAYRAVEQIKDGLYTSSFGCDNNKMTIRNAPHILVLGNEPPNERNRNFHPTKYNVKKITIE